MRAPFIARLENGAIGACARRGKRESENIKGFLIQPEIDAALVGGPSLISDEFVAICQISSRLFQI